MRLECSENLRGTAIFAASSASPIEFRGGRHILAPCFTAGTIAIVMLIRSSGFLAYPGPVRGGNGSRAIDDKRRHAVRMSPLHGLEHLRLDRSSRLDEHRNLARDLDRPFPTVNRRHARHDVDASGESCLHEFPSEGARIAFVRKRAIDHYHSLGAPDTLRIGFVASPAADAQAALQRLTRRYPSVEPELATVIVALGGDGLMLQTLHRFMGSDVPIYGMHRGSVGFLMNEYHEERLLERVANAKLSISHPIRMQAENIAGEVLNALAINEVHLFRQTAQSARLSIIVDGKERLSELICDGVLLATPAGSTAYNLSVGGPILPLGAQLLALTPISPFRPRRWRGALLSNRAHVRINVIEALKRPMSAVADHTEFRDVVSVQAREERGIDLKLLFDPGHALEERILAEQFHF